MSQAQPLAGVHQLMVVNTVLVLVLVGAVIGVALVLVRRSLRQQVESARLTAMGTATARILHQVKNPLQTVLLHAEMLEDEALVSDAAMRREVCRAIIGEATRMSELLSELSSYASGIGRRLRLDPLPLDELLRDAARRVAREAVADGIEFVVEPVEPVHVAADPYFLRQAFENVIRNACEALQEAGAAGSRRVVILLRRRGGEAVVEVGDNGPGMDAEHARTVFEPFVTTRTRAMGLGLSICREIVEGHGGRVDLRTRPGAGVSVSITLPLERGAAPALQPA